MPKGVVKEVERGFAFVHLDRQDMCGDCHACEAITGKKQCVLKCIDRIHTKAGDLVEVSLEQSVFLKATYIMYGVPFIGFIVGLVIGYKLSAYVTGGMGDLLMVIGALLGTGIALGIIKLRDKKKAYQKYMPHIIAKLENE